MGKLICLLTKNKSCLLKSVTILLIFLTGNNTFGQLKPTLTIPTGHQQKINSISFSQDGKLIATGSGDNTFIIWDAATGYEIRKVNTGAPVQQVLFSPDASYLITACGQNEARYTSVDKLVFQKWDVKTGKMLTKFPFTGLPDIRFIKSSGNLLIPGYSDDLSKKQQSDLDKLDFSDPDKTAQQFINKINYDSIEKDADKKVEEMMKGMDKIDLSDPKAIEAYTKKMMNSVLNKSATVINPLSKSYTLLDPKNFQPVANLGRPFEKSQLFTYNNKEYIVALEYIMSLSSKKNNWINIWPLQDLMTTSTETKEVDPWKKFSVSRLPAEFAISQAKGFFAYDSGRHDIQLWQLEKNIPVALIKPKGDILNNLEFSADGNALYVYSTTLKTRFIEGWNTQTFQQITSIQIPQGYLGYQVNIAPSGDYFVVENRWSLAKFNLYGDAAGDYKGHSASPGYYGFFSGDKQVYANYYGVADMSEYILLSIEAGIENEAYINKKTLSKEEEDKLVKERMKLIPPATSQSYNGYNLLWDLAHGGAVYQKAGAFSDDHRIISTDKNYILTNERFESGIKESVSFVATLMSQPIDGISKETAEKLKKYRDPNSIYFKTMFAGQLNGPVTLLINKKTTDTISLIKIDSLDWIMTLKNGYYMTSKNGAKALTYVSGLQVYPFEQFDIKYNRPDLVLKAIGMADQSFIDAYRNAYQKRITRLDIDTTQFKDEFEVPEANFSNKDKISHEQKTNKLSLDIAGVDNKNKLDRYNIWVNEVPVFGKKGKSIKESKSNKLTTTVEITLSQGMNKIETSVINVNGIESYRSPLFVKYSPDKTVQETVHFIGIGIDRFADNKYNLQYSSKDIRDLSKKLKEKYKDNIVIDTLFNEGVTTNNIKALKQKLQQSTEDDKVIVAYSGHGLLSKDFDYYLSTYNINFDNPEQNGLAYDELENLLDGIRSRKKLLLIDACHSGEVDKEDLVMLTATTDSLIKGLKPIAHKKEGQLGLENSFDLMQSLFVNVGKNTGAVIISAAAGTQFALERNDLKNGVFTYSILEAINNYPTLNISELKKIVSERVEQITKGLQKPTSRNETIAVDWSVW